MPMLPEAPGRLSMTIDCPSRSPSLGEMMRATKSDAPPGANGTIILIVRFGYGTCPRASVEASTSPTATVARVSHFLIAFSSLPRRPQSPSGFLIARADRQRDGLLALRRQVERLGQHQSIVRFGCGRVLRRQSHRDPIQPLFGLLAHRPAQFAQCDIARRVAAEEIDAPGG